jgi:hypothetical protein
MAIDKGKIIALGQILILKINTSLKHKADGKFIYPVKGARKRTKTPTTLFVTVVYDPAKHQ